MQNKHIPFEECLNPIKNLNKKFYIFIVDALLMNSVLNCLSMQICRFCNIRLCEEKNQLFKMTETETSTTAPAAEATKTPTQEESTSPPEEAPAAVEETNGDSADAAAASNGDSKAEVEPPKEMRAIVLTGYGGLKGVKCQKKPEPSTGPGEVLIRVKAW